MTGKRLSIILALIGCLLATSSTSAQDGAIETLITDEPHGFQNLFEAYFEYGEAYLISEDSELLVRQTPYHVYNKSGELLLTLMESEEKKIKQREIVISTTNRNATIIFFIAHTFLAIGIVMAYKEIQYASKLRKQGKGSPIEISASLEGVALKSSLLGFAVFMLSIAFYFAYLKFVYPIITV